MPTLNLSHKPKTYKFLGNTFCFSFLPISKAPIPILTMLCTSTDRVQPLPSLINFQCLVSLAHTVIPYKKPWITAAAISAPVTLVTDISTALQGGPFASDQHEGHGRGVGGCRGRLAGLVGGEDETQQE